jgi:hypothetical protein
MQGVIFSCERMAPGSYRSGREINYCGYEHCVIKKILSILGGELKVDQFETGYVLQLPNAGVDGSEIASFPLGI